MEAFILEAQSHFTQEEWMEFDESEQLKYSQVCYIYFACVKLGIEIVVPDFMLRSRNVQQMLITEKKIILFTCEYCKIGFAFEEDNIKHMKKCNKRFNFIEKKKHACNECNFSTDYLRSLKQHKQSHATSKTFLCTICQKSFISKLHLTSHTNRIHANTEKQIKCDKCSYTTNHKHNLTRHIKIHSINKTHICQICCRTFSNKQTLERHLFKHNNKEKPFKCLECNKSFLQNGELTRHMNAIHLKNKQFKCHICEYSSAQKGNLMRHIYTHSSVKPIKCNICDYQCAENKLLAKHLKNKHTE